ncbi:hypothetical protein AVEN_210894-1 [Araneus ventricosus]|uniref:Uncharacterized protein n=1 Tax=Araneus ventricosus TaxID=182803 RepID=A0A4Y2R594_ARAVE|nr:hypothetical protein AVEN_210894-1 [Araneus ventricosus]
MGIHHKAVLFHLGQQPVFFDSFKLISVSFKKTPKRINAYLHFRFLERASIPLSPYFSSLTPTHNPPLHRSHIKGLDFSPESKDHISLLWTNGMNAIPTTLEFQSLSVYTSYQRDLTLTNGFGSL